MGWWFGRILTFEVFGDEGRADIAAILDDASDGLVLCEAGRTVSGYAAYGQSMRAAIQPLVDCYAIELTDDGLQLAAPTGDTREPAGDELGSSSDGQSAARLEREQAPARLLPSALRLGYYDPARDYQAGEARATSAERNGQEEQKELPAAVSASDAKSLAQAAIARAWAQRDKLRLRLPPRYLDLQPGTRVQLDLSPRSWTVEQCTIDGFVVIVELRPSWNPGAAVSADPGRIVANKDVVAADVKLALFDIPDVLGAGSATPLVLLAASNPSSGWKSCAAEIVAIQQIFQSETALRKSVLGRALTALPTGDPHLINRGAALEIELVDPEQWLLSCDDDSLVAGANLAVLGSELIQFGNAEPLGEGRFRLSKLLRGRAGTEWAMADHAVDEPFALIERDTLRLVPLPSWAVGSSVTVSARNLSGANSSSMPMVVGGESLRPLSPVALQAKLGAEGDLLLAWTRRTRAASAWIDEVDVPLGESRELYRITITGSEGSIDLQSDEPVLQVSSVELAAVGVGTATVQVRQVGDWAASRPAECSITI